ncbi:phosphoenolpyruvate carboxylase [bacterium]|nr:phosphoenolpyruvate carboxylase [bacterium]
MAGEDLQELRQEVRWLGGLLGQVISELDGPPSLELEERIRNLAKQRRLGDQAATQELFEVLKGLNIDQSWMVCRAFTLFFDLSNLAEDRQRVRTLRSRPQLKESLDAAIHNMHQRGLTAESVQQRLDVLHLEPVFTAHPTEAKRRAVRLHLQRLRRWLQRGDSGQKVDDSIREIIETLWHTDLLRPRKPTVLEEVARGLATVRKLWNVIPRLHRELMSALARYYPETTFQLPAFLQFGTWMGGDRDGNPFVTSDTTAKTLRVYRKAALKMHYKQARRLFGRLTQSEIRVHSSHLLKERIQQSLWQWPALNRLLEPFSPYEIHRRWLRIIQWRLKQALRQVSSGGGVAGAYTQASQLRQDLLWLQESLGERRSRRLEDWLVQVQAFGFHLARLDIRQESEQYHLALGHILENKDYADASAERKREILASSKARTGAPQDPMAQEVLSLFRLLAWYHEAYGQGQLGCHILSMTHEAVDIQALLWLQTQYAPGVRMPLVPLFETIKDLERGPEILRTLFSDPEYRQYLKEYHQDLQVVMVGYSDSTKDGGYLAANWWLYRSQQRMQQVAGEFGIDLRYFHGRGGALGRGGGPAARSILSLPIETTRRGLRLTEQGEVLSERYDYPPIAHRHLEQLLWSLLEVGSTPPPTIPESWIETLNGLAQTSLKHYRELVDHPGFIDFFQKATPIQGVERMAIGSRPSRRPSDAKPGLSSLRAIPWVFSWTQNRAIIPAWYGIGTAFQTVDSAQLAGLYQNWPFFRAVIDNAELALAKADIDIARCYAQLAGNETQIMDLLAAEFERSRAAVLALTGRKVLLESQPWLERSIRVRNPYVDPLNLIQVETFRRLRATQDEQELDLLWRLLRMTIQGVAAGLRTTG